MNNIFPAIMFSIFLRWSTALFDYSGQGKPPMYGDYEAQRHWMEITYNLPIDEWYFPTEKNDLQYWGLDYPPLTAYHSLLMGHAANYFNSKYVALNESRGFESPEHKLFMRFTVLLSDLPSFILGTAIYSFSNTRPSTRGAMSIYPEVYVLLTYPGLILIDYGHFQYNCVSLGLSLMSYTAAGLGYDIFSAIFFCLSISYKQMLLYFSLPFFFYHLGKCRQVGKLNGLKKLVITSGVVILTFALTWYPVSKNSTQLFQVIKRIFPISRGVFEDKVSNIWCLVNMFIKFRLYCSNEKIAVFSAVLTLCACLPSCINLFYKPSKYNLNICLIISSLAFFLCSYQVHEKSILIVALPVMLFFRHDSFHCFWFLIVSSCSMFPLVMKDNLVIAFIGLHMIFITTTDTFFNVTNYETVSKNNRFIYYVFRTTLFLWVILLIAAQLVNPPTRYPDLFPLIISCYSAVHFIYFFLYFNYVQLLKTNKKCS